MAVIELKDYLDRIKSGRLEGRYLIAGEEEYLKRYYLSLLKKEILPDEAFAAFNHVLYDGPEVDFAALSDAIKSPPMMSEYKLVEWRYADFSRMKESEFKALEELLSEHEDFPYTVLVFVDAAGSVDFGTPKKKSKFLSRFEEKFTILRFERSSDKQLHAWLKKHFDANGISVGVEAVSAMVEQCGHSMDVLKGEVDKLCAYAAARSKSAIGSEDVALVCSTVEESDAFAFSNAITERNRAKLFSALSEMKKRRVEPAVIFGMAQKTYSELLDVAILLEEGKSSADIAAALKMSPYKLKIYLGAMKKHSVKRISSAIDALSRADVASKSGGVTGYTAVEIFLSEFI